MAIGTGQYTAPAQPTQSSAYVTSGAKSQRQSELGLIIALGAAAIGAVAW